MSLTQDELASKAHIGTKFLSSIERCVTKPSLDTFIKIAKALNASCDSLITKEINKKNSCNTSVSKQLEYLVSDFPDNKQDQLIKLFKDIHKLILKNN